MRIERFKDGRGELSVTERLPFEAKRVFWITNVPDGEMRAGHALKNNKEILIAVKGECRVSTENIQGGKSQSQLVEGGQALYMPPLTWAEVTDFSPDCVLLVLCSHEFDEADFITDHGEFIKLRSNLEIDRRPK